MSKPDESRVIHFAEAQARIPGPNGERDFLFVAAGTEHRFDGFSEDVAYWRVFYGPPGGELPP